MKSLIFILIVFFQNAGNAQSPSLSVQLFMDSSVAIPLFAQYKIEMKICEPLNKSPINDYFNNEKSSFDFKSLAAEEISCGAYKINQAAKEDKFSYRYSNQLFAWEKILILRITNLSGAGHVLPMFILLPVEIKSFITHININEVEFQAGKFVWVDKKGRIRKNSRQEIKASLKAVEGFEIRNCSIRSLLDF